MADSLSTAPQAGHNSSPLGDLTPADMRKFLTAEASLKERRAELTADTRAHKRNLEAHGVPMPGWNAFVKVREEAGSVRERNLAALTMLLGWDMKPFGLQASMDLTASQGSPELNVHELKRVDTEGFDAGKAGKKRSVNPYTPSTEAAQRFDTSWLRGQTEIASEMAPSTPPADNVVGLRRGGRPKGSKNKAKLELVDADTETEGETPT